MAKLTYEKSGAVEELEIGDEPVTIGRQLGNHVTLNDDKVSRYHCVIEHRRGVLGVRDLGSRNGTCVNGEKIKSRRLGHGDVVRVGATEFKILLDDEDGGSNGRPEVAFEPDATTTTTSAAAGTSGTQAASHAAASAGRGPGAPTITGAGSPAGSPERMAIAQSPEALARIAGQLPKRNIKPGDMVLLNARGKKALDRGEASGGAPAESITLLRLILLVCFRTGASDIHVEPRADGYTVRVRIDGTMVDLAKLQKPQGIKLTSLIKVMADIDISKTMVVQEGSFACRVPDRRVDYRVSFTPGLYGQKLVVRVLDAANAPQYLWDLGLSDDQFALLDRLSRRNEGMILVCGPTGSGKSSTLYAMLRSIDHSERNVVTIEDPIEIRLDGITQMPVNEQQGNTFAALLRSVLRQDPDVVLVGEIRDGETAGVATQAAQTGHLVFSTLHSRDSVGAVFRLMDLGVEPYQAAAALQTVVSQRLLRRLCHHCRRPRTASDADRALAGRDDLTTLYDAVGCRRCLNTGFGGRRAVFEVLHLNEPVREAILGRSDAATLYGVLKGTGFRRLRDAALDLVVAGETTLDEVERVS